MKNRTIISGGFWKKARPWHIVLFCLVVRLSVFLPAWLMSETPAVFTRSDTPPYLALAKQLLFSHSFSNAHSPEVFRTPAYPVFLIPGLLSSHVEITTILIQILLSALTVYLVFKSALIIFEDKAVAAASAFLYASEPLSVVYSLILLTETLFTFTLMCFLFLAIKLIKNPTAGYALAAGLFAAICSYIRPVALYLSIFAVILQGIYIVFSKTQKEKKRLIINLALMLFVSLLLTGIWQMRNLKETGYGRFSSVSDFNLYFYHRVSVMAKNEKLPFYQVQDTEEKIFKRIVAEQGLDYASGFAYMQRQALKTLSDNVGTFAVIYIKGIAAVLFSPGATEYAELFSYKGKKDIFGGTLDLSPVKVLKNAASDAPLLFAANVFLGLLLILCYVFMVGGVVNMKKTDAACIFMFIVLAYFILLSGGVTGYGRFRHPVMPVISIFGGYGLLQIIARIRSCPLK
ncbi:MAG: glycosyltransferase family 39 protein [Nitrospirae bacterium YQR-1]